MNDPKQTPPSSTGTAVLTYDISDSPTLSVTRTVASPPMQPTQQPNPTSTEPEAAKK